MLLTLQAYYTIYGFRPTIWCLKKEQTATTLGKQKKTTTFVPSWESKKLFCKTNCHSSTLLEAKQKEITWSMIWDFYFKKGKDATKCQRQRFPTKKIFHTKLLFHFNTVLQTCKNSYSWMLYVESVHNFCESERRIAV